jgi:hypothetical protein
MLFDCFGFGKRICKINTFIVLSYTVYKAFFAKVF